MHRQSTLPLRIVLALAIAILTSLGAGAGTAGAGIYDPNVEPSHAFVVRGDDPVGTDYAYDVVIGSGVTYVAGIGSYAAGGLDATLTRISHATWTASTRHYDSNHRSETALAMALGPDGTVYTAGTSSKDCCDDMLVVKWSKYGAVVWARRYNGPANGNDSAVDIAVDRDGNVVVCGPSTGAHGFDWAVVSWTRRGVRRWAWRYDGSGRFTDVPQELLVDRSGSVYVCGSVTVAGPKMASAVAKLSSGGAKRWVRTYTGPLGTGADAQAIAADPRGGVLVAGYAEAGATGRDAMVLRYSATGGRTAFPLENMGLDAGPDVLTDLAVTKTTRIVVGVGYRNAPAAPANPLTVRYTLTGAPQSASQSPSAADDRWYDVVADPYGGCVMAGSLGADGTDVHTRRETPVSGGAIWESRWTGPVQPDPNVGYAVAARGNVVVTAGWQYTGATTGWDQVALFYVY
jgi:hypothetical protein